MVLLGTLRVAHTSNRERWQMVTGGLPIAQGRLSPSDLGKPLTAKAVVFGLDRRVQWYPYGARWADGSYKYIRVMFPVYLAAGTAGSGWYGGLPYTWYNELLVNIEDEGTTLSAMLAANQAALFQFPVGYVQAFQSLGVSMSIDGVSQSIPFYPGAPGTAEVDIEASPAQTGGVSPLYSRIRCWRGRTRIGKGFGFPSFWVQTYFESHSVEGTAADPAYAKFWVAFGNSYAQGQSETRWWADTEYDLTTAVTLTFTGEQRAKIWHEECVLPGSNEVRQVTTPETWSNTLTLFDPNDDRSASLNQRSKFPDGSYLVYQGVLTFPNNAQPGAVANTLEAMLEDDVMVQSVNWPDHGTWGIFGFVPPRPTNSLIQNDTDALRQACLQANDDFVAMTEPIGSPGIENRDPYGFPSNAQLPRPPTAGGQPDIGAAKGWHVARSGCPDMRSMRLSAYKEGIRPQWYRDLNVELFDSRTWERPNDPSLWSNFFRWNGTTHMTGPFGGPLTPFPPEIAVDLGKNQGVSFPPKENRANGAGWTWEQQTREHTLVNFVSSYTLMSADRWMLMDWAPQMTEFCLSTLWPPDEPAASLSTLWRFNQTRAEGRMLMAAAHMVTITDDADLKARLADRMLRVTTPFWCDGNFAAWNQDPSKVLRFTQGGSSPFGKYVETPLWQPWQEATSVIAHYATSIALANDHAAESAVAFFVAQQIAKSVAMYGVRNNADSGNVFQPLEAGWYIPRGAGSDGEPLEPAFPHTSGTLLANGVNQGGTLSSGRATGAPSPNPSEYSYAHWNSVYIVWTAPAFVIGYVWSGQTGDSAWRQRCREVLEEYEPTAEQRLGTRGWDDGIGDYTNSHTDWVACVEDPFEDRTLVVGENQDVPVPLIATATASMVDVARIDQALPILPPLTAAATLLPPLMGLKVDVGVVGSAAATVVDLARIDQTTNVYVMSAVTGFFSRTMSVEVGPPPTSTNQDVPVVGAIATAEASMVAVPQVDQNTAVPLVGTAAGEIPTVLTHRTFDQDAAVLQLLSAQAEMVEPRTVDQVLPVLPVGITAAATMVAPTSVAQNTAVPVLAAIAELRTPVVVINVSVGTMTAAATILDLTRVDRSVSVAPLTAATVMPTLTPAGDQDVPTPLVGTAAGAVVGPARIDQESAVPVMSAAGAVVEPVVEQSVAVGVIGSAAATVVEPTRVDITTPVPVIRITASILTLDPLGGQDVDVGVIGSAAATIVDPPSPSRDVGLGVLTASASLIQPGVQPPPRDVQVGVLGTAAATLVALPVPPSRTITVQPITAAASTVALSIQSPVSVAPITATASILAPMIEGGAGNYEGMTQTAVARFINSVANPLGITVFGLNQPTTPPNPGAS